MDKNKAPPEERQDIARARIAAEREARTGRLDLGNLGLRRLPEEISEMQWIESLRLSNNPVADLSPLAGLSALRSLDCRDTDIADLSPLTGFSALRSFDCSNTQVADLAPLAGLSALRSLSFWGTQVADLSPLAGLSALRSLNCSDNQVSDISSLAGLSALRSLDCLGTQIPDLSPLAGLSALRSINCLHSRVVDISPLAKLPMLADLNCWAAPLFELPAALIASPALKDLVVGPDPALAELPAEVLSQHPIDNCLPRLRAHLEDLKAGSAPLPDAKVLVLGNARIGKTQICRRLLGEPFEEDADSTHGIGVRSATLPMPDGEGQAILDLWDFGGQDIYHGTHALFMRTRAVFLLVWTPESERGEHSHGGLVFKNRPLPYWLEYIRHLGGAGSPVILVQNRCDGGRGERANLPVDDAFLGPFDDGGRFFRRVAYSAKDDSGRAGLGDALQQAVRALRRTQGRPLMGRNRLAVIERLRAWRDADAATADPSARRHRLIPYADFEALCREHGVHAPETFAEVLHHAGTLWYRPGLFGDRMVLDQSWALNAVYALFTREGGVYGTLRRLRGRFTRADLDALLWGRRGLSAADQRSLLAMMERSGICFVHRRGASADETEYLAPDLLPEDRAALGPELAARWDPSPGEPAWADFAVPFLSPAITRAILSDLGELAGETALYWRSGVCLYDGRTGASALVEEVPDPRGYAGRLQILTKGTAAEALRRVLVQRILTLNAIYDWSGIARWLLGPTDEPAEQAAESGTAGGGAHEPTGWPSPSPRHRRSTHPDIPATLAPTWPPAEAPARPEVYVSFAWARERQDPLVGELIASLNEHNIEVLRDSDRLRPGDRISHFMQRLSAGRCVLVVLSAAYLRSEYCMTELHGIWRNARQQGEVFLDRIVPLVQDDAAIGTPAERIAHAVHWKREHDALNEAIREHGADVIGELDFARFKLMADFYRHVGDMLALANDVLVARARDRPTLARDGFAQVRGLVERALA